MTELPRKTLPNKLKMEKMQKQMQEQMQEQLYQPVYDDLASKVYIYGEKNGNDDFSPVKGFGA